MSDEQTMQAESETVVQPENQSDVTDQTAGAAAEDAQPEITDAEKIEALTKENAELKDQLLRRIADFDNYRKRMIKEKQEAFDYANTNLLKDLLDSLDNFDRTVAAAETAGDAKSIADGVKMINKSLVSMLESKYNLTSYGNAGDEFNPDEHEAIGSCPGPVAVPTLKEVYLKGYKLKDRVIRNAKVMVTMPDGSVNAETSVTEENAGSAVESE